MTVMDKCKSRSEDPANFEDIGLVDLAPLAGFYGGIPVSLILNVLIAATFLFIWLLVKKKECNARNMTLYRWLKTTFIKKFEDIDEEYGFNVALYLRFQWYTILFLIPVTFLSLAIILPVHLSGEHEHSGNLSHFEHSTISNIQTSKTPWQWIHYTSGFVIFLWACYVMRQFSRKIMYIAGGHDKNVTLMVRNVPRTCERKDIKHYFHKAFRGEGVKVKKVTLAYDHKKLHALNAKLESLEQALDYCRQRPRLKLYNWFFRSSGEDALEYYQKEFDSTRNAFEAEQRQISRLDIVFVTFRDLAASYRVHEAFQRRGIFTSFKPPLQSDHLRPESWTVMYAPLPRDMKWSNLNNSVVFVNFKHFLANGVLIIIAFFVTTPQHLFQHMEEIIIGVVGEKFSIAGFLTSGILVILTYLMQYMVILSNNWIGFYTRSQNTLNILVKTFLYLLPIVVILPTIGYTSVTEVIWDPALSLKLECFFLPDSGAGFINYTIQMAFIGNAFELSRLADIFFYFIKIFQAKSEADKVAIRKSLKTEFPFGEAYARHLLMLTMAIMFCLTCPLIVPFTLIYFIGAHYVDRHNIFNVYERSNTYKAVKLPIAAIVIVVVATLLHLCLLVTYSVVYNDWFIRQLYVFTLLCEAIMLASGCIWWRWWWSLNPLVGYIPPNSYFEEEFDYNMAEQDENSII